MRAIARRSGGTLKHHVEIGGHRLVADEPSEQGGTDAGPSPEELLAASLASCSAITMEVQLPAGLPEEQREKLMQIVAKCPVHRTLEGEVMFEEQVSLV
ncbi:MAG TPA: OsmC family protein [Thermoleophilaceae bacterium]|nr:OsmC family protein [Thermoleophilaceae bacterium]